MFEFLAKLFRGESSGAKAKERLRLVLLSDHLALAPDIVESLKTDLLDVISRYVEVDVEHVDVTFEQREHEVAMLANVPILSVKNGRAQGQVGDSTPAPPAVAAEAQDDAEVPPTVAADVTDAALSEAAPKEQQAVPSGDEALPLGALPAAESPKAETLAADDVDAAMGRDEDPNAAEDDAAMEMSPPPQDEPPQSSALRRPRKNRPRRRRRRKSQDAGAAVVENPQQQT
jgi:cell division topological specificity factor